MRFEAQALWRGSKASWVTPQFEKVRAGQVLGSRHSLDNKKSALRYVFLLTLQSASLGQLFDGGVRNEGYATASALMAFRFLRELFRCGT